MPIRIYRWANASSAASSLFLSRVALCGIGMTLALCRGRSILPSQLPCCSNGETLDSATTIACNYQYICPRLFAFAAKILNSLGGVLAIDEENITPFADRALYRRGDFNLTFLHYSFDVGNHDADTCLVMDRTSPSRLRFCRLSESVDIRLGLAQEIGRSKRGHTLVLSVLNALHSRLLCMAVPICRR